MTIPCDTKDLGAHITYTRQWRNAMARQRISGAKDSLHALECLDASFDHKVRLICSSPWPQALHALEGNEVSQGTYKSLRTSAVRALRLGNLHVQPLILLGLLLPHATDPQFRVLRGRLARVRVMFDTYPQRRDDHC